MDAEKMLFGYVTGVGWLLVSLGAFGFGDRRGFATATAIMGIGYVILVVRAGWR